MGSGGVVRRVVSVSALAAVAVLGFGAALGLAGSRAGTPGSGKVGICQSGNGKHYVYNEPDKSSLLVGHGPDKHDIVPPFVVVEVVKEKHGATRTTTTSYPGQNMDKLVAVGYKGDVLLAEQCQLLDGAGGVSTEAVSVTTVPRELDEPGPTVTSPGMTTVETLTEEVVVPPATESVSVVSTVATVAPGETSTESLPDRTVTLPSETQTTHGEQIVRPAETVTIAGTTRTETGGTQTTVETVTGPHTVVEAGADATKEEVVTVTAPSKTVTEPAQTVDLHEQPPTGLTVTEQVLVTRTEPATTVTAPPFTTTETKPVEIVVPANTVTVPATTTVVTVPAGVTTTVTVPDRRVTVPPSTGTVKGETVVRPSEVVTLPALTRTVSGGAEPTVATVTGPRKVVEEGAVVTKRVLVRVTTPRRVVRVRAHRVRAIETKVIVVVRARGCPRGTTLYNGRCSHNVRGKG